MGHPMSRDGHVLTDHVGTSTLVVTLNRTSNRNALSADMVDALHDVLDEAERSGVRVLILRSAAGTFSSGFGLDGLESETDASLLMRFARIGILLERLSVISCVTVAVVEGPAIGAGADVALACDHRVGTSAARFRFPGAGFGVVLGSERLSELLGSARALNLATGAASLDATESAGLGLMTLSPQDELADRVTELGRGFDDLDLPTLAALKAAGRRRDMGEGLADLIRSIAGRPGLKNRLTDYVSSSRRGEYRPFVAAHTTTQNS